MTTVAHCTGDAISGAGGPRCERRCTWPPWWLHAATPAFATSIHVCVAPASQPRWRWWPACANCWSCATACCARLLHGGPSPLDFQDSCFPPRPPGYVLDRAPNASQPVTLNGLAWYWRPNRPLTGGTGREGAV